MNPRLKAALDYACKHNATKTEAARACGIRPDLLSAWLGRAKRNGAPIEWPGKLPSRAAPRPKPEPPQPKGNPDLDRALEYAREHGTSMADTARALGISPAALGGMLGSRAKAGNKIHWPARRIEEQPDDAPIPTPELPELVRHVRNGTPYWEEIRKPFGAVGRGPTPPTYPTPADGLRRHNTIPGLAWRWALDVSAVEAARVRMGMGVFVTDAQARLLGVVMGVCA